MFQESLFSAEFLWIITAYTVDRKGYHLYLENIPTHVCTKCGERAYDEKEAEAIQGMIAGLEEGIDKVRAAV